MILVRVLTKFLEEHNLVLLGVCDEIGKLLDHLHFLI